MNSGIQELLKLPEIQNRYPEEYLTRLDDCCSRHANSISLINDTPKLLSERELQILERLCQAKTKGDPIFVRSPSVTTIDRNLQIYFSREFLLRLAIPNAASAAPLIPSMDAYSSKAVSSPVRGVP